ncbi:Nn.00g075690.m01.CDS01 [Neocucurbitaria sp. VM-36]
MATTISVNGVDGVTLARSSGIRLVQDNSQALVLRNQQPATRHGRPGNNAHQAIPGGPAGTLAVQLSESQLAQGAIHVRVVESSQAHRLARDSEVPIGRDLRLTAIGGIGESGHGGEDGQRGMNGVNGIGATRGSDATNGTDGGDGGAAGRGSCGADGGPGGDIHVIIDESSTHLLMAVSWDLRGGVGGRPSKHGKPGSGGTSGTRGEGWLWEEIVGYKYFCTDSCMKNEANVQRSGSTTTAMIRMGSRLHASSSALTAPMGALLVSGNGNNLQRAIVQARRAYHAVERPRADPGACKCGGGTGNCTGCDMKPIRKNLKRAPGLDGRDGETGNNVPTPLLKGSKGNEGTVTIAVQHEDGPTQRYTSVWSLELVDFDLEDENADGIFEPGEYLNIRRVRVRNVGGMPSPSCQIPVTLADHSDIFEEVTFVDGGVAYLPTSIPAAGEASMEGSIKVRIKPNTRPLALGTRFCEKAWLQIRADMPWLERRLPSFELRKEVNVAYPCGFGNFDHLSSVAQGAISKIHCQINNFGNQPIGEHGAPTGRVFRLVEVSMTIPEQYGRLMADSTEETTTNDQVVPAIRPKDATTVQQQFRVLGAAKNHDHFKVTFDLYLESPEQPPGEATEMVLVERRVVILQVSSTYTSKPNARFLLVTNPHTTERQSRAIQDFIQNSLHMEVDLCNIHQNGGLLRVSNSNFEDPISVLSAYRNKTVIFLVDTFEFFGGGAKTSTQLCDPKWLHDLAENHSSSLFIGTQGNKDFGPSARRSVFPLSTKTQETMKHIKESQTFASPHQMVECVKQEKKLGTLTMSLSTVTVKAKWYHFPRKRNERAAQALASFLRERLPNERFVVSHDDTGNVFAFTGLSHDHFMRSVESHVTFRPVSDTRPALSRLDRFSKSVYTNVSVLEAFKLSIIQDLIEQMSRLQTSKYKGLLRNNNGDQATTDTIIKTHLPFLSYISSHMQTNGTIAPPDAIIDILAWSLAYASTVRRHSSLEDLVIDLLKNCPSTTHFPESEEFRSRVTECNLDDLIKQISELTQKAPYMLEKGITSASTIVPETEYWAPSRWDAMVREMETKTKRLQGDMESARKELGRMLLDPVPTPADSAAELSG